ncbi:MAG TPA: DUF2062 domain-containing protein [Bdellovibrionales bacterium]|nr:DUF2062 domain-containing protein [Bdellovibrionales bacterium]
MILRIAVVVPTYNNPRTISSVVKDIVTRTKFPVVVIDDGSETPVANVLYSFEVKGALETGRVRVVRFEKNRGKGAALRFAIRDLAARGFTHMLTMDGDGQHLAGEIAKLVDLARAHPWDLVIGHRKLESRTVPGVSKFGRAFSNFWVKYQTGLRIFDSQSGFRVYPLFVVQTMSFRTRKYDFEIEALIRFLWSGGGVREVEIECVYPEPTDRVSHFHKFWDNARISMLNTLLVAVSLMRSHRDPRGLALALGFGVFIGFTPFYGFHTFIAIGLAVLLRLNVLAVLFGSQVSLPPLAPLVIWASVDAGERLGVPPRPGIAAHFEQWLVGGLGLGAVLGLGIALLTYALALYWMRAKAGQSNWSGRTRGGRLGNGFLKLVLRHMNLRAGYFCLYFIVPYFWLFAPKARRTLNEYYRLIQPRANWFGRQKLVLRHFFRFGQVLMDRVYQGFHGELKFRAAPDGMHHILDAVSEKSGLILLSAHLGGWDLAAALLGAHGFDDKIHVVEYLSDGLNFQKIKDKMDPHHVAKVDSNLSTDAIFEIHQALKRGQCIGLMGDRPIGDRFELIPFFGKLAPFDVTAFRLAAALRVPLLFTFGFKGATGEYDFFARAPRGYVFDDTKSRPEQLYDWASEYVREVESFARRYPEQWFNFYPFWSSLPVSPTGVLAGQGSNLLAEEIVHPPARRQKIRVAPSGEHESLTRV